MYKFDIKIAVYDCTIKVVISKDIRKVINSYVKRKKWDKDTALPEDHNVHGLAISNEDMKEYYVFYDIEDVKVKFLTHEISHIVDFILVERDLEDKGEAKAYLTGYISEKIFDYILKKNLLINQWYKPVIIDNQKTSDEKPS